MRLVAKEDITAPAESVFSCLSDFAHYERAAIRRGAKVARTDGAGPPGPGSRWTVEFRLRRRRREAAIELRTFDPPRALAFDAVSPSLSIAMDVIVIALSRTRTRISVALDVRPRTLKARLLLQSARLARGNIERRFGARLRAFAAETEARCRSPGPA